MRTLHLCVLGDAHLMPLKAGWELVAAQYPDVRVTFYAAPAASMNELFVDRRRLKHRDENVKLALRTTSGISEFIDIDAYDILVVHGLGLGLNPLLQAAHDSGALTKKEAAPAATPYNLLPLVEATPALRLARVIAGLQKPVLLSCQPLPNENVKSGTAPGRQLWLDALKNGSVLQQRVAAFHASFSQLQAQRGYICQPEDTVAAPFFTRSAFAAMDDAATTPLPGQPLPSFEQANAELGSLLMASIVAQAKQLPVQAGEDRIDPEMTFLERVIVNDRRAARESRLKTPYSALPERAFWKKCVRGGDGERVDNWYRRKFDISGARIATAGGFFSQHLGTRLLGHGFDFIDTEPAPADFRGFSAAAYGYATWSARFGEVTSSRQLLQLFDRAFGEFTPAEDAWKKDGGFVDPFRPAIAPDVFSTVAELKSEQEEHLAAVREMFTQTDVFVFTLSATEVWASAADGAVFPVAPGACGGEHDPAKYRLLSLNQTDVIKDLLGFIDKLQKRRPEVRFIFTVSPLPMAATALPLSVLTADGYSKAILRAACGHIYFGRPFVDYFPAYEMIVSPVMGGRFHTPDFSAVTEQGVEYVMQQFFEEHQPGMPAEEDASADEFQRDSE